MTEARSNEEWVEDLQAGAAARERALADLRQVLEGGLPYALSRWLSPQDPGFDSLMEESIQETLLRVQDRLESFRGESKLTTWAHKIAIRLALTELRRKRWQDVSLEDLVGPSDTGLAFERLDDGQPNPEVLAMRKDLMERVGRYLREELTDRQRKALVAVGVKGMPTEEVARRLGTNRNALYKLLHDARLKLKARLAQDGLDPGEILATFEE